TNLAATINSDYTPAEKDQVLESIKNGEKSILYLSPETLLSNTDIAGLIGDRKIGLLVVDEAHIVATWGKSFRPDYWYLGDFISKLRKNEKSDQNFPIATFTATSTFGGDDNMYLDIIESLRMTPERFLGRVK
ncbi:DEAD/DEAH box helicase, partial [Streptococcus suis]